MLDCSAAFAAFPVLETERLRLRAVTLGDAPAIFQIMGDPRVIRYFGCLPMPTLEDALERARGFAADFRDQAGIRWAIVLRNSGRFVGTCGYWRLIKAHWRAEIGYELAPEYWGQGIMTEALTPVLRFGFGVLGLHSIEAQIHPSNIGSRRVLEKLGFVQEGYFHQNYYDLVEARFTDTAVFSLLAAGPSSLHQSPHR